MSAAFWFMIAVVGTAGIAFISIVVWLGERAKERETHFRGETLKKVAESGNAAAAMEYLRETEKVDAKQVQTKARLAGLITAAAGVALMIFLHEVAAGTAVYLVGLIPLLVGAALLFFSEVLG